jgi:DNA-binding beta-propeller fold protein YncE
MHILIAVGFCLIAAWLVDAAPVPAKAEAKSKAPTSVAPKAGIKTPGIQIPFGILKSEVEVPVETPGWITVADSVFVPNKSQDAVVRIDPKTNKALDPLPDFKRPCSGAVIAFTTLWVPNCGAQTVTRFDIKANKVTATIAAGAADVSIGISVTPDSVWMITDSKTTLSRIDPAENKVVAELRLPAGCNGVAYGENSLWVTCPSETRILRINPGTNLVDKRIDVSPGPRAVAFGARSVWVLCEKGGKIERIDPKTNKVIKTIELNVPNAGGNLAFGDGFLWVAQAGFPLTRIDPQSDKERVAQQFWGDGGGLVSVSPGAIWLSNVAKGTVARFDPKRVIATLAE